MKQLLTLLFALTLCTAPCQAQFGFLNKISKSVKTAKKAKELKQIRDSLYNTKVKDIGKNAPAVSPIDTASEEFKKSKAEFEQNLYKNNPQFRKIMELKDDTAALRKYMEEQYGGMSQEKTTRKALEDAGYNFDSKDVQDAYGEVQKMSGLHDDPVFKKIVEEGRQPTMQEALYLNEKYGTDFEYEGLEAYKDSLGVFAHIDGLMKPLSVTLIGAVTDERPAIDLGLDELKKYVKDYITFIKKPLADREIVDSVQNYMVYDNRHADEQFNSKARFTIYSNNHAFNDTMTINDLRKYNHFMEPIDPQNIFIFKVHKGIACRYMEYMYTKISYKQSELNDYQLECLSSNGYLKAYEEQTISDEDLFKAIDMSEYQFKAKKLKQIIQNNDKFMYANVIPAAKNVKMTSNIRKVGGHVTALDICIDAEPGEYAFFIRNPEVEEGLKHIGDDIKDEKERKQVQNVDISILTQGVYFFTIK